MIAHSSRIFKGLFAERACIFWPERNKSIMKRQCFVFHLAAKGSGQQKEKTDPADMGIVRGWSENSRFVV